jgi:hypothetical protein
MWFRRGRYALTSSFSGVRLSVLLDASSRRLRSSCSRRV